MWNMPRSLRPASTYLERQSKGTHESYNTTAHFYSSSDMLLQGADKSLARPGRNQGNVSVRMAWISFGALLYKKKNLMTARVSMLLKSRASLTFFPACFLPGRAKDLSALRYYSLCFISLVRNIMTSVLIICEEIRRIRSTSVCQVMSELT